LREYIRQLNEHGYNDAPLEVEASMKSVDIFGRSKFLRETTSMLKVQVIFHDGSVGFEFVTDDASEAATAL